MQIFIVLKYLCIFHNKSNKRRLVKESRVSIYEERYKETLKMS